MEQKLTEVYSLNYKIRVLFIRRVISKCFKPANESVCGNSYFMKEKQNFTSVFSKERHLRHCPHVRENRQQIVLLTDDIQVFIIISLRYFSLTGYADRFRHADDQVVFLHVYEAPITPPPTFARKTITLKSFSRKKQSSRNSCSHVYRCRDI